MCLQNLIQYGESIDREATLQAQNQKSASIYEVSTQGKQYINPVFAFYSIQLSYKKVAWGSKSSASNMLEALISLWMILL